MQLASKPMLFAALLALALLSLAAAGPASAKSLRGRG
jgi:hypothetical protein